MLDISFDPSGERLVSVSADCTGRVYNVKEEMEELLLLGHTRPVSKVSFNSQGTKVMTSCEDCTVRLWDANNGDELQLLEGTRMFTRPRR